MVLFVQKVGVVGAGVMGAAIGEVMALNGKQVVLKDIKQDLVEKGLKHIDGYLDELVTFHAVKADKEIERIEDLGVRLTDEQKAKIREVKKPTYTADRAKKIRANVKGTTETKDLADCDLIIEAATENLDVKRKIFKDLDENTGRHVLLATNTSALSVTAIAAATSRPKKVLGLHFFNPPTQMPLVEVVPGLETDEGAIEDAMGFLQELRNHRFPMQAVRVRDTPGFLVNRILGRMLTEAYLCYEEGLASPRDIDLAMKAGAGMPMGPLELTDQIGVDVIHHVNKNLASGGMTGAQRNPIIIEQLFHAGRFGKKSGRGFYEYETQQ